MSQSYYDATGRLYFQPTGKVTPVIRALFGAFEVGYAKDVENEDRQVLFRHISEGNEVSWSRVGKNILDQAQAIGLELGNDAVPDDPRDLLFALLEHFDCRDVEMINLVESTAIECDTDADLGTLFKLAQACDDGHGLQSLHAQGAWHASSDRVGLGAFGGDSYFFGKHFSFYSSTSHTGELSRRVNESLAAKDHRQTGDLLSQHVHEVLNNIVDPEVRIDAATSMLAKLVQTISSAHQPTESDDSESPAPSP